MPWKIRKEKKKWTCLAVALGPSNAIFGKYLLVFFFFPSYYILYNIIYTGKTCRVAVTGSVFAKRWRSAPGRTRIGTYQWTRIILGVYTSRAHYCTRSLCPPVHAHWHIISFSHCVCAHIVHTLRHHLGPLCYTCRRTSKYIGPYNNDDDDK